MVAPVAGCIAGRAVVAVCSQTESGSGRGGGGGGGVPARSQEAWHCVNLPVYLATYTMGSTVLTRL